MTRKVTIFSPKLHLPQLKSLNKINNSNLLTLYNLWLANKAIKKPTISGRVNITTVHLERSVYLKTGCVFSKIDVSFISTLPLLANLPIHPVGC
jgi:hypothetical protein